MTKSIKIFEDKKIRVKWVDEEEKWYFSIVDVIAVLTESEKPNNYWKVLKHRLKEEGSQLVTNCNQLKLKSSDGKYYLTDVGDTKQIFRLIQSIPSKKAEPFKMWLAQVGSDRINEIENPELSIDRALETYYKKGYSQNWINQRLKTIEVRKELTDEWDRVGVKEKKDYAILTNEITKAWSDLDVKSYKKLKGLKKENLRDNMTNLELVLNMLAEVTTTDISKSENPKSFEQSKDIAKRGGKVANIAKKEVEKETGKKVVTSKNTEDLLLEETKKLK